MASILSRPQCVNKVSGTWQNKRNICKSWGKVDCIEPYCNSWYVYCIYFEICIWARLPFFHEKPFFGNIPVPIFRQPFCKRYFIMLYYYTSICTSCYLLYYACINIWTFFILFPVVDTWLVSPCESHTPHPRRFYLWGPATMVWFIFVSLWEKLTFQGPVPYICGTKFCYHRAFTVLDNQQTQCWLWILYCLLSVFFYFWIIVALRHHINWVNIGSGNGLLHGGINSLPKPI